MTEIPRADLHTVLQLEQELEDAIATALRSWLEVARAAALPALTAAAIPSTGIRVESSSTTAVIR
ncbi:hypothetical protein [Nocardia abscessus]|uniref:hypothetical protein n=1 Tax=Nocardia abscessus TaxID=120957 RepID=UPI002454C425|nr:hypothetical protein [Nocardia abscessus]